MLFAAKGENVFKSTITNKGQQFLESLYESIAIGIYFNVDKYSDDDIDLVAKKIDDLEEQQEFQSAKGTGTNTEIRIRKLVPFSKTYFDKQ